MYLVYWIRRKEHNDIYNQGYVGITRNFKERMRQHKKNRKKTPLTDVIKTSGWESLIIETIKDSLTQEEALSLEEKYRPNGSIGWNLQKGGEVGVGSDWYKSNENKVKHQKATSVATKIAIAQKDSKENRSQRAKEIWKKTRHERVLWVTGERNPKAKLTEKQVKEIREIHIPAGLKNPEIAKLYGVEPYVISFIRTRKTWKHI